MVASHFVIPVRTYEENGELAEAAAYDPKEVERCPIRPVQVIEHDHSR
jgi:hypothetical protein